MLFGKHVNKFYIKYGIFFLIGIAALIVVDYFQLEIPDIIGSVIDELTPNADGVVSLTRENLLGYIKHLGIVAIILFFGRFLWRVSIFGNGIKIESDLRNELFYAMQKQSQEFFQDNKTGALMTLYTNDLNMIRRVFGMGTIMLIDSFCLGGLTLYRMIKLNPWLALLSFIGLVAIMIYGTLVGKKVRRAADENFEAFSRLSDYVQEDIAGIAVVKAFVKERLQIRRYQKYNKGSMDASMKVIKLDAKTDCIFFGILSAMYIMLIVLGGLLVYKTKGTDAAFSVGDLTRYIAYFDTLIWPIQSIGRLIRLRSQGKASLDRVSKIIDHEVEINDDLADMSVTKLDGEIEFNHLDFSYPLAKRQALHDVTFKINKGEFVGIIGATGSGKSTIVELLLRLYNLPVDAVKIDGKSIMEIPLATVRRQIAYAPQDNFLYSTTISENIAFSSDEVDQDKVEEVTKISDVYDDICEFTDKFDTVLGERGVTVSGGQKQRMAIARALYKDASILILDDSLSAVDTETEDNIIKSLRELRKGKTTIIIAHRITTLQNLDKIVVVEDGTVTGVGTHNELLETNHAYAKEVKYQELEKEAGVVRHVSKR